jgi:hypothetical protein
MLRWAGSGAAGDELRDVEQAADLQGSFGEFVDRFLGDDDRPRRPGGGRDGADSPEVQVRVTAVRCTPIHRFDDHLLAQTRINATGNEHAPVLHLRRTPSGVLFDPWTTCFQEAWVVASPPRPHQWQARVEPVPARRGSARSARQEGGKLPVAWRTLPLFAWNPDGHWEYAADGTN